MDVRRFMDAMTAMNLILGINFQGMKLEVWREQLGANFPEFQKSQKRSGDLELPSSKLTVVDGSEIRLYNQLRLVVEIP